jgi:hypothetical protein
MQPQDLGRSALEHDAMTWLVRSLPRCVVPADAHHSIGVKALMDLSLLTAVRTQLHPNDEWVPPVIDHIRRQAATEQYRSLVQRNPQLVNYYGLPYAALVAAGATDATLSKIVRRIVQTGVPLYSERPPHRQLDVLYYLQLLGIPSPNGQQAEDVLALDPVAHHPNVLLQTEQDAYAIAHTVLYATGFGLRKTLWPGASLAGTRVVIEMLLDDAVSTGDVDLAAELACSLLCIGGRFSPSLSSFWLALDTSRQHDGSHTRHIRDTSNNDRALRLGWAQLHHCTVVVALALTMDRRANEGTSYPVDQESEQEQALHLVRVKEAVELAVSRGSCWLEADSTARSDAWSSVPDAAESARESGDGMGLRQVLTRHGAHGLLGALRSLVRSGAGEERAVLDGLLYLTSLQGKDGLFRCCPVVEHHVAYAVVAMEVLRAATSRLG